MSNPRLPTFKLRQIIQFESSELSARELARALNLSHGAISKYRCAVRIAGMNWEEAQHLDDAELERRIWTARTERKPRQVVLPDCATIHTELKRHKHVTLQLLWDEYHAMHGTRALRYSSYCERYRHWVRRLQRSMRQRHYAGEKLFVDYAGATVPIYGATCEEAYRANIFVGALGASGYAYAEATRTASLPDWLGSHVRMLTFHGHAPTILVPDNPRVGVTKADRYEPELQRSYEEMAAHYSMAVIPARPFRPKDKPKAELTVLLVCRWVLARLRHQRFFSLEELNAAIRPLLVELNERPFQKLPGCRPLCSRRWIDRRCGRCRRHPLKWEPCL
jgi:transposase